MEDLQQVISEVKLLSDDQFSENYGNIDEYFLDQCRYGQQLQNIRDLEEFNSCIQDQEINFDFQDSNLNNHYRKIQQYIDMVCANGHIELLKELLKINTKMINQQNKDGNTPLHWAVMNNQKDIILILLENDVDVQKKNCFQKNPLEEAIDLDLEEISVLLASKTKDDLEKYKDQENYQVFGGIDEEIEDEDQNKKIDEKIEQKIEQKNEQNNKQQNEEIQQKEQQKAKEDI